MQLLRLSIERVRNLSTVVISDLQPFNIFYGENGSGKTSILEAIHVLATGRSFRTHLPKIYIQHQTKDAVIFAQSENDKLGIQKYSSGEQHIRINGDRIATQGQLAKRIPIHYLDPQSTEIIDQGAKLRRQLLDWLVFHLDPMFYTTWQQYRKILKQRNHLLKMGQSVPSVQLDSWDKLLAEYGEQLHQQRLTVIQEWQYYLQYELEQLLPDVAVQLNYYAGFDEKLGLRQHLHSHLQKDIVRRNTEYGAHRADLHLKTPLGGVDAILSRGQKKLLIIALKLSQISMLHSRNRQTVVLLDDLSAELDHSAQRRLFQRLLELGSQVFVTVLEKSAVEPYLQDLPLEYRLFHVEHGQVHVCV